MQADIKFNNQNIIIEGEEVELLGNIVFARSPIFKLGIQCEDNAIFKGNWIENSAKCLLLNNSNYLITWEPRIARQGGRTVYDNKFPDGKYVEIEGSVFAPDFYLTSFKEINVDDEEESKKEVVRVLENMIADSDNLISDSAKSGLLLFKEMNLANISGIGELTNLSDLPEPISSDDIGKIEHAWRAFSDLTDIIIDPDVPVPQVDDDIILGIWEALEDLNKISSRPIINIRPQFSRQEESLRETISALENRIEKLEEQIRELENSN